MPRFATVAAASAVALLALGGTAFALGADDTPSAPATSSATAAPEEHRSPTLAVPAPSSGTGNDVGDDHGSRGPGADDAPGHDTGDDHGRHDG